MTRTEGFVLLAVAAILGGHIAYIGSEMWFAAQYGVVVPTSELAYWKRLSTYITALVNVVAAVWLYAEAKAQSQKAWVWSLLGLMSGLLGVVVFYAVQIHKQRA